MKPTSINTPFTNLDAELTTLRSFHDGGQSSPIRLSAADITFPPRRAVCLMPFPYTDGSGVRVRPTVVVAHYGCNLIVVPVTTHGWRDEFDVPLQPSEETGLRQCGTARCSQIASLSQSSVIRIIGHLLPDDYGRVVEALRLWFHKKLLAA